MSNIFEITVKINEQKFDICILEDKNVIGFAFIYPKLKQVVKIGANEDIDFKTHDFEVFNYYQHVQSTNGVLIESFNHYIKHQSLIEIKLKPKEVIRGSDEHLIPVITINGENPDQHSSDLSHKTSADQNNNNKSKPKRVVINDKRAPDSHPKLFEVHSLIENRKAVEDFHRIVLEINIGWNFLSVTDYWRKVSAALRRKKIIITEHDCCSLFNTWINYYALYYDIFDGKITRSSQEVFDLLKVVHTLDLRQLLRDTNQTLHKIERISKTNALKEYFRKHLFHIYWKKMNEKEVEREVTQPIPDNSALNKKQNSRSKSFTKIRENNERIDSNPPKSVQRVITEGSDTQMNANSDPRLRKESLLYRKSLQSVDPRLRKESLLYQKSLQSFEDNHKRSETH